MTKVEQQSTPAQRPSLARRVEEASLNAWPALQQTLFDGWLLRFSRGFTKRANAVVPVYASSLPLEDKVRYCENIYAREQLRCLFRLTEELSVATQNTELDQLLEERNYSLLDPTLVMATELVPATAAPPQVTMLDIDPWIEVYAGLTGMPENATKLHGLTLKAINNPIACAVLMDAGEPVACGLAVQEHELVGLFDIITHPERRERGFGRKLVKSLLFWGASQGARHAYLQVIATNSPALALYRSFGFEDLYRYWYRASA